MVLDIHDLFTIFQRAAFDVVICTEMLEHVEDWRGAVDNLKQAVAPGGVLLLSTRAPGFPRHEFPGDYWRFTLEDLRAIFADFKVEALAPDTHTPGIFVKARRPEQWRRIDLSSYAVAGVG